MANASTNFIGVKEASGDLIQATRILKDRPEGFIVTSGDDEIALSMIAAGGDGGISVIANAYPSTFSNMVRACLDGNFKLGRTLNNRIYDLHKWLYIEGNPVGIKSAMKILNLCDNDVRLPLTKLSSENYSALETGMNLLKD